MEPLGTQHKHGVIEVPKYLYENNILTAFRRLIGGK